MHRTYENNDIVVFWNSDKCFHAKMCVTGSPKTFDINRKPWIDVSLAENAEIWQTVEKCPSGALKVLYRHEIDVKMEPEKNRAVAMDGEAEVGECEYSVNGDTWTICHTGVRREYEGKGIAKRLVYKVLEAAEKNKKAIEATCWYAKKVIEEE